MSAPNDPVMLLSYINTNLRDNYASFHELCMSLDLDMEEIANKLEAIGYTYNSELNRFA